VYAPEPARYWKTILEDDPLARIGRVGLNAAGMAAFDLERFVKLSRAVDLSDIDWDEAARIGITDDEHKIVRYMADTEAHTIVYMRDLLAGHTARDPEVTAFMACWVYEETHHGLALDRFLRAVGRPASVPSTGSILREEIEAFLSTNLARASRHFAAAHMAWGALNEATAAAAYNGVARTTANPQLAKLVARLGRDERRHYSFYYSQAEKRLAHPTARLLCRAALRWFWGPVGIGVGGSREVIELIFARFFARGDGREEISHIESKIRELPGLHGFDRLTRWRDRCVEAFARRDPARFASFQHGPPAARKPADEAFRFAEG
jgi:rubrerythrin